MPKSDYSPRLGRKRDPLGSRPDASQLEAHQQARVREEEQANIRTEALRNYYKYQSFYESPEFASARVKQAPTDHLPSPVDDESSHPSDRKRQRKETEDDRLSKIVLARREALQAADLDDSLCQFFGPGAQFRPGQKEIMQKIIEGDNEIIAVMPAGSGKSLLFSLPAFINGPTSLTIVLSPLIASMQDRMQKLGKLRCHQWANRYEPIPEGVQLVFVSPEKFINPDFAQYIQSEISTGRLHNIIYDDAHSVLLVSKARPWRPALIACNNLSQQGVQAVYLTATLPPIVESDFFSKSGLSNPKVFRQLTTRPSIRYEICKRNCPLSLCKHKWPVQATWLR